MQRIAKALTCDPIETESVLQGFINDKSNDQQSKDSGEKGHVQPKDDSSNDNEMGVHYDPDFVFEAIRLRNTSRDLGNSRR